MILRFLFNISFIALSIGLNAQDTLNVVVENADTREFLLNEDPPVQKLIGNVRIFHNGTYFYCDSAILVDNSLVAYGNVILLKNDTIAIFSDSLTYSGNTKEAVLYSRVILGTPSDSIYTQKLNYNTELEKATYSDKALIINSGYEIKSQEGFYDSKRKLAKFYNKVSVEKDKFRMVNDSLEYRLDSKSLLWNTSTVINEDSTIILSGKGSYFMQSEEALFEDKPQILSTDYEADGRIINSIEEGNIIEINGDAVYKTATDTATAERIIYNKKEESGRLINSAEYRTKDLKINGKEIVFNKNKGDFNVMGDGMVVDSNSLFKGQQLYYNDQSGLGSGKGQVIYIDYSNKVKLDADSIQFNNKDNYALALGNQKRPMLTLLDGDTIYIASDTLLSDRHIKVLDSLLFDTTAIGQVIVDSILTDSFVIDTTVVLLYDTIDYYRGIDRVKIFSKEFQGEAGDLYYTKSDSIMQLTEKPFLWQDSNQMNGDTIFLYMKDGGLDKLRLKGNAYLLNTPDALFYNQIKGDVIDIDFKDGKIDKIKVNRSAQSVYYLLDDTDAYIGVEVSSCNLMVMFFKDKTINKIARYPESESKILPMKGTDHRSIRLSGYNNRFVFRSNSIEDIRQRP